MKAILETIMRATGRKEDLLTRWMRDESMQRHLKEHPQDSLVGYKNRREVTKGATYVCLRTEGERFEDILPHPDDVTLGPAHIKDDGLVVFGDQVALFLKTKSVKALTVDLELTEVDDETVADIGFYPASRRKAGASVVLYGSWCTSAVFPSLVGMAGSGDLSWGGNLWWDADLGCLTGGFAQGGFR